ncbi:MAG: putative transport system permease protein [Candidatus Atribacteria bacterium]|nr:putative transport system permease protein [Candidatus Atribacteria bacterium]
MNLSESLHSAILSISGNKLRSFLTMLGIIIGVAAVVAMVSLGEGVTEEIVGQIGSLGSNQITILPGRSRGVPGAPVARRGGGDILEWDHYLDLEQVSFPAIKNVIAENTVSAVATYGRESVITRVVGTTPAYPEVRNFQVEVGHFFTQRDLEQAERVAVLGKTIAQDLFLSPQAALGKKIRIGGITATVVGVMEEKSTGFQDLGEQILIPITTMQKRLTGSEYLQTITVQTQKEEELDLVAKFLEVFFTNRLGDPDKFSIFNQQDVLDTINQVTGTMTLFLAAITGISLLVGGIGIMNIMLVSVTERTREIGLRKAIGARPFDILLQFVIESSLLSALGGLIGIVLGIIGSQLVARLSPYQTIISPEAAIIAFSISVGVGLFFGIYPARRASQLDPITALRYE